MHTHHCTRHARRWASAATLLALTGVAQAALINQGDGTVKDTNTNLIWLQDWRFSGLGDRATQIAWADNLTFAGSSDWRLPSLDEYRTLLAYGQLSSLTQFVNTNSGEYWTATTVPALGLFRTFDGGFGVAWEASAKFDAAAVRTGTTTTVTTTVPEPQSLALALLALGAVALARRSRG